MNPEIYPYRFHPVYKNYIWGGTRIPQLYGREVPPGIYAESWEVSDHPDGESVVARGPLAGLSLRELCVRLGDRLLGEGRVWTHFPLLIKLIDARDRLSVQVHPDDESAARYGGEAKTEMWYLLDAAPGAQVFAGLKPGVGPREFQDAISKNRVEELLTAVPVQTGDTVFIPGGRIHAIDAGCLILEVQQSSNTTYRVYDWGRVGQDGKPRPLHIREALEVIRWEDAFPVRIPTDQSDSGGNIRREIHATPYFRLERVRLRSPEEIAEKGDSFAVWFTIQGSLQLEYDGGIEEFEPGSSCLIPAALKRYRLVPLKESTELLRITTP